MATSKQSAATAAGEFDMLTLGTLTHVGMVRESNQDAYCALVAPNAPLGADALLAVADGMGGHAAGDVASRLAIQQLVAGLSADAADGPSPNGSSPHVDRLRAALALSNSKVNQAAARPELRGMGTTMTAVLISEASATIVQVGDSRAYLLRDQSFQQVTRDHSWVAEQVAAGALTGEQAKTHPRRNILTRALGTGPTIEGDLGVVELREGDHLLLCSDGLHGLVGDEEMAQVISEQEPQQACQALVDRANERGGHDNTTVIVARIERIDSAADRAGAGAGRFHATTLPLGAATARPRGLGSTLFLALTAPLWVPFWMLGKALRAPLGRGGGHGR